MAADERQTFASAWIIIHVILLLVSVSEWMRSALCRDAGRAHRLAAVLTTCFSAPRVVAFVVLERGLQNGIPSAAAAVWTSVLFLASTLALHFLYVDNVVLLWTALSRLAPLDSKPRVLKIRRCFNVAQTCVFVGIAAMELSVQGSVAAAVPASYLLISAINLCLCAGFGVLARRFWGVHRVLRRDDEPTRCPLFCIPGSTSPARSVRVLMHVSAGAVLSLVGTTAVLLANVAGDTAGSHVATGSVHVHGIDLTERPAVLWLFATLETVSPYALLLALRSINSGSRQPGGGAAADQQARDDYAYGVTGSHIFAAGPRDSAAGSFVVGSGMSMSAMGTGTASTLTAWDGTISAPVGMITGYSSESTSSFRHADEDLLDLAL